MHIQIRRIHIILGLIPLLLTSVASVAGAQSGVLERQSRGLASPALSFQWWKIEDTKIHQLAIPITFLYPVNEKLQLNLATSPAFSTLDSRGTTSLNGFSDARFSGTYLFKDDRFMATFGVNLPSGKHALKSEEFVVASVLALHAFDFMTPILGQGLDVSAGIASAHKTSTVVLGFGAGFLMRGAFSPIENASTKYNPGDEITFSVGVDYPMRQKKKLMFDVNYTLYTADNVEGDDVFQAGNRFSLQAMAFLPGERSTLLFTVRERIRAKNKLASGEDLIPERQNSNGNELQVLATLMLPQRQGWALRGTVEGRFYSNNAYEVGGATIGGGGIGAAYALSPQMTADVDARFYVGSMDTGFDQINVTGLRVLGGLKVRL